jgi:CBS domain-containing protein
MSFTPTDFTKETGMFAKDIMTRTVVSVSPDSGVLNAAQLMLERHVSGLVVIDDDGALVGVLTEGDLL